MVEAFETVVDDRSNVKLLEPVRLKPGRRAFVLIPEESADHGNVTELLGEAALSDWARPQEDTAWSHQQSGNWCR